MLCKDRKERLATTDWDPDGLRDDLRSYVVDKTGDPDGVLVVDETGFLKKGRRSAGVARQYSGTAGRVENCQIGVFLTYATKHGRTFLDRELYLPKKWTDDPDRCAGAGVPGDPGFKTKPVLAIDMIERALGARVPAKWVAGNAVYGQYHRLRRTLEERGIYYVLRSRSPNASWSRTDPISARRSAPTRRSRTRFRPHPTMGSSTPSFDFQGPRPESGEQKFAAD